MTGKFFRHKTRSEFLEYLWNEKKVRTIAGLIKEVKKAEKAGTLVVKRDQNKPDEVYEKNIRWYMGQLEREGKVSGFLGPVGRPKSEKKSPLKGASKKT